MLALTGAVNAPATGHAPTGALGANYNEHFEDVHCRDLEKAQTHGNQQRSTSFLLGP